MTHVQQTIALLEQELEVTHGRCHELERALETLRPLAGGDIDDDEAPAPRRGKKPANATKVLRGALVDVGDKGGAILAMLKKHGGVMKPGDLARAMKLEPATLRYQLKPLETSKQVLVTGVTAGRRISLPGAKEAP